MGQRKPKHSAEANGGAARVEQKFPPEAFAYDDDVTPAAVQQLRDRAKVNASDPQWKVIDGFGAVISM